MNEVEPPQSIQDLQDDSVDGKIYEKANWCFQTDHRNPESEVEMLACAVAQLIFATNGCEPKPDTPMPDENAKKRILKLLCLMQLGIPNNFFTTYVMRFDIESGEKLVKLIRSAVETGLTNEQIAAIEKQRKDDVNFKEPVTGAAKCMVKGLSFLMNGRQKFGCNIDYVTNPLNLIQISKDGEANNFDVAYVDGQGDITNNAANGKLPCLLCLWQPFNNGEVYTVKKLPVNLIDAKAFKEVVPDDFDTTKKEEDLIKEWFNMELNEHYVRSNKNNKRMQADGTTERLEKVQKNALIEEPTAPSDASEYVSSLEDASATGASGALPQEMFLGDKLSALQTPTDTQVTQSDALVTRNDIAQLMSSLKL